MLAASRPELVITDLKMGGMDGLSLFDEIRKQAPTLPVIILTAHGTIPDAVAATRRRGFRLSAQAVRRKAPARSGGAGAAGFRESDKAGTTGIAARLGDAEPKNGRTCSIRRGWSPSRRRACSSRARAYRKELLARAIHRASRRSEGAFVAVQLRSHP